jgi:hypothetical protein
VTLGCAKVGLVGDMTSFRGSFFLGDFERIGSGCVAFLIKFRYLTGIKKICEEVIRNYFHLAHISDSGVSRRVNLLDFEGWGLH